MVKEHQLMNNITATLPQEVTVKKVSDIPAGDGELANLFYSE